MSCQYTKDINEVLGPESLAANMLSMKRFPDQSQTGYLPIPMWFKAIELEESELRKARVKTLVKNVLELDFVERRLEEI